MSDKDYKRLMQCLLIACAFVLVLLYLYFTKGACWEMKGTFATIAKFALIGAISLPTLCALFLVGYSIWNSDKINDVCEKKIISIYCWHCSDDTKKSCCCNAKKCSVEIDGDESFIYITKKDKDSIIIPDGTKNVVVQTLDDLKKGDKTQELKNVYVVCPSYEVSAEDISSFGFTNAKIHFNTNGKIFTMEIKNNDQQITTLSTDGGDNNQNNSEVGNAPEQPVNEDTKDRTK